MIYWLLLWTNSSGVYVNPTYTVGILHPVVDTAGNFSTDTDPDAGTITDVSAALNPIPEN